VIVCDQSGGSFNVSGTVGRWFGLEAFMNWKWALNG